MHKYYVGLNDNTVPADIHKAAYKYLQSQQWNSSYRHVPDSGINPSDFKNDLIPYVAKKTVYRSAFGCNYTELQEHAPIAALFDCINDTLFSNKFELTGKALGTMPDSDVSEREMDDQLAEKEDLGCVAYMKAQAYEPIKRTRVPHRDWDDAPLDSDEFYTIVFVANLEWNPLWHSEMFFYGDDENGTIKQGAGIGWISHFATNVPGRVIIYDSRMLHNAKQTSTFAPEFAQRIAFRVKLKEGEKLVPN